MRRSNAPRHSRSKSNSYAISCRKSTRPTRSSESRECVYERRERVVVRIHVSFVLSLIVGNGEMLLQVGLEGRLRIAKREKGILQDELALLAAQTHKVRAKEADCTCMGV